MTVESRCHKMYTYAVRVRGDNELHYRPRCNIIYYILIDESIIFYSNIFDIPSAM